MVTVSFTNDEYITINIAILDDNLFQFARDIAESAGLDMTNFKDLTIEGGRY